MIVTLNITTYTHDAEHFEVGDPQRGELLTLQFSDVLPDREDRIRTEDGRSFRVEWREWLPGGLVLHVSERVQQEAEAA
jgi:hypothetical protein